MLAGASGSGGCRLSGSTDPTMSATCPCGALQLAADLRGQAAAEQIQLEMEYAPKPPFNSGTPETAPAEVLAAAKRGNNDLTTRRVATAERVRARVGVTPAKAN